MHKALRTADIVEAICSFLDARSLEAVFASCSLWREIVTEAAAWRKLAHRTAAGSPQRRLVLEQKGLGRTEFSDSGEEAEHFRNLCLKFEQERCQRNYAAFSQYLAKHYKHCLNT